MGAWQPYRIIKTQVLFLYLNIFRKPLTPPHVHCFICVSYFFLPASLFLCTLFCVILLLVLQFDVRQQCCSVIITEVFGMMPRITGYSCGCMFSWCISAVSEMLAVVAWLKSKPYKSCWQLWINVVMLGPAGWDAVTACSSVASVGNPVTSNAVFTCDISKTIKAATRLPLIHLSCSMVISHLV